MSDSRSSFFRQSAWLAFGTVVGGVFMTAVHPVVFRMERSQYEIFGAMLRAFLLLGIPSAGLMTSFAQQGAAALTPEARARLATTTQRVLCGIVLLCSSSFSAPSLCASGSAPTPPRRWSRSWPTLGVGLMWLILPVMRGLLQGAGPPSDGWQSSTACCGICLILLTVLVAASRRGGGLVLQPSSRWWPPPGRPFGGRGHLDHARQPVDWPEWLPPRPPLHARAGAMLLISNVDVLYFQSILTQGTRRQVRLGKWIHPRRPDRICPRPIHRAPGHGHVSEDRPPVPLVAAFRTP